MRGSLFKISPIGLDALLKITLKMPARSPACSPNSAKTSAESSVSYAVLRVIMALERFQGAISDAPPTPCLMTTKREFGDAL